MTGWGLATMDMPVAGQNRLSVIMKNSCSAVRRERFPRIRSMMINILVSLFYGFFLYTSLKFYLRTGSLVGMGLVAFNTLVMTCLLIRRNASSVTESVGNWVLASLTQVAPLLLRPLGGSSAAFLLVSTAGQVVALAIMISSMMVLNRSIGVVAANRGVKTRGPYSLIRHPLYAGEILFDLSFLLSNWSYSNGLLICALMLAQVARSLQEEILLQRDERYVLYRSAVRYRLVPGIF